MTQPSIIPLVAAISSRYQSLTVDSRVINGFVEKNQLTGETHVYKRPGFKLRSSALPAGVPRGLTSWRNEIYAIIGAVIYKNGVALAGTVNTAGGSYTFASGLGPTPKLFLHNATNGYVIDTAGLVTAITDVDFPPLQTPARTLIPGSIYLNGVFYVMDTSAVFGNSDDSVTEDDPLTWSAATLTAGLEGVDAVAIAKQLVYVIAFKRYYAEAFYDAANPAPANPLGPVQGAKMNFGLRDARTLADCGGDLLFVSQTTEGSVGVSRISSLSVATVSTPPVERILEAADYTTVHAWSSKCEGHRFYGITLPASNVTLVYDLTSQLWYQWTDTNGNYLPYAFSCLDTNNRTLFLHESSGRTFNLDGLTFSDDGELLSFEIYTPNASQDMRTKIAGRLDLVGDRVVGSNVELRWSDNDYATWSLPQNIDMGLERPGLPDMGSFYRRAFHFKHRANLPCRLEKAVIYSAQGA